MEHWHGYLLLMPHIWDVENINNIVVNTLLILQFLYHHRHL